MGYATITDVESAAGGASRLRALSTDDGRTSPDTSVIQRAIEEAEEVVKLHVGRRYGTEGSPPITRALVALVADEAVFILKKRRGMLTETDMDLHKERLELLEGIGSGKHTLGVAAAGERSPHIADAASSRSDFKAVSREKTKGFW